MKNSNADLYGRVAIYNWWNQTTINEKITLLEDQVNSLKGLWEDEKSVINMKKNIITLKKEQTQIERKEKLNKIKNI